jgi:hypothetical protein
MNFNKNVFIIFTILLTSSGYALAFKLSPVSTELERQRSIGNSGFLDRFNQRMALSGIYQFTEPVHEEITQRIFGCEADAEICSNINIGYADQAILAGVRWNDDPPFRLTGSSIQECKTDQTIRIITQPICWAKLFKFAEKNSGKEFYDSSNSSGNLMYRSHFGDLQFLHSMASKDGEPASTTRSNMLMWAEFAWRASMNEYKPGTLLKDIKVVGFDQYFGKVGWNVQDIFTLGNPLLRKEIPKVAFGSLLHMIQDSFAYGHASRRDAIEGEGCPNAGNGKPGAIEEFRSYQHQNHESHAEYDSRQAFGNHLIENPSVVSVGRDLLSLYNNKASWDDVKPYLECVLDIQNPGARSSAGLGLER